MPVRPIHGLKPDVPDIRDRHFRTDYLGVSKLRQRLKAALLPRQVDLRKDPNTGVYDQGHIGSCVDNALATMLGHITAHVQGGTVEYFSRLFMYGNARGWTKSDDGSTLREAIKGVDKFGVPLEVLWPYDLTRWQEKPPDDVWHAAYHRNEIEYYRLDTVQGMKLCLSEGYPFIFGIAVYDTFSDLKDFTVPMPTHADRLRGGHALCAMGYDDDRKAFLFRNSWGQDWGMAGHAWLPYEYVRPPGPWSISLYDPLWMDAWTVRKIPA